MFLLKLVRGAERATGVQALAQVHSRHKRFVIGRDPKCEWPIPDRELALSARHCEVVLVNGQQVLRDLSTNGTFVNGSRKRLAGDHVLRHGDRIGLGSYLIEVTHVSDTDEAPQATVARTRMPPRGGDPAAMVGPDWQHAEGRSATPSLEMNSGFTRISKPWLDTSTEAQSSVFATVPNVRPSGFDDTGTSEVASLSDPAGDLLRSLAAGLGVGPEALGSGPPGDTVHHVGRLLRVAMFALHHQLALQSRQMRELGSRAAAALAASPAARLRLAPGPQEAVGALLASGHDGEAMLVRAHAELGQHTQRILAAFETTCQRLAEQLDPATLEQLAQGKEDPARVWLTYGALWTSMGMGEAKSWPANFVDAAFTHLATAYDETPPAGGPATSG
ncbi:MAG: FHA domain-containing protein [Burkholderiales bacterium]|nr:FHA domain-containing protein [Burkholderiales bacterium]